MVLFASQHPNSTGISLAYCVGYIVEGPTQLAGAVQYRLRHHFSDGTCGILRHLQWHFLLRHSQRL